MKRYTIPIICIVLSLLLVASCAPSGSIPAGTEDTENDVAGFWKGLWHGFIMLFTFIISLFKDSVGIYESNNSGNLYNLGYLLGVMIFFGGSSGGACRKGK
jgi:hypothetical protein